MRIQTELTQNEFMAVADALNRIPRPLTLAEVYFAII
jgi:hypothetical protein